MTDLLTNNLEEILKVIRSRLNENPSFFVSNETQTKTSLINPLLKQLGYNPQEPNSCILEFCAGFGKEAKKVDYALLENGIPVYLLEAKPTGSKFDANTDTQLEYYMHSERHCRMEILTNGIIYKFFRKNEISKHKEREPFFTFNVEDFTQADLSILMGIRGGYLLNQAETLRNSDKIK